MNMIEEHKGKIWNVSTAIQNINLLIEMTEHYYHKICSEDNDVYLVSGSFLNRINQTDRFSIYLTCHKYVQKYWQQDQAEYYIEALINSTDRYWHKIQKYDGEYVYLINSSIFRRFESLDSCFVNLEEYMDDFVSNNSPENSKESVEEDAV